MCLPYVTAVSLLLGSSICSAQLAPSEPEPNRPPAAPAQAPVAMIQAPPVKPLAEELVRAATQLSPEDGQMVQMSAMMFLGSIGYPSFPGFVPETGLTMVYAPVGESATGAHAAFILTQLTEDENISQNLPFFNLAHRRFGDWTVISNDPEALQSLQDIDAWTSLPARERPYEITATWFNSPEYLAEWRRLAQFLLGSGEDNLLGGFLGLLMDRLEQLPTAQVGLDLEKNGVELAFVFEAAEGSPEAALINAPVTPNEALAQRVPATGSINLYGGVNYEAWITYLRALEPEILAMLPPSLQALWLRALELFETHIAANFDGMAASYGGLSLEGGFETLIAAYDGSFTEDDLSTLLSFTVEEFLPALMAEFNLEEIPQMTFESTGHRVAGAPIWKLVTSFRGIDGETRESEVLYALTDGPMIMAANEEQLADGVLAINKGVEGPSVLDLTGRTDGMAYTIDVGAYLAEFVEAISRAGLGSRERMAPLSAIEGEPARFEMLASQGTARTSVEMSFGLIASMAEAFATMRQNNEAHLQEQELETSRQLAVRGNLRQIASAGLQYILETGEDRVSYATLVKEGYLAKALTSVAGEDYHGLVVQMSGSLSVELADGTVVEYDY